MTEALRAAGFSSVGEAASLAARYGKAAPAPPPRARGKVTPAQCMARLRAEARGADTSGLPPRVRRPSRRKFSSPAEYLERARRWTRESKSRAKIRKSAVLQYADAEVNI